MAKKKKEEVAVTTNADVVASVSDFFGNIDFSKLNDAITKLAAHKQLSKVEKKSAIEIINSWNENVINKISVERKKISEFVSCIQPGKYSNYNGISSLIESQKYIAELEFIIDKVGMNDKYEELMDAMDDYNIVANQVNSVPELVVDENTTAADEIIQRKDIEIERIKRTAALKRVGNIVSKLNDEIITAINNDKDVIKAIRALKRKERLMEEAQAECTDKANIAKINVTIDNADVREALIDIIKFSL